MDYLCKFEHPGQPEMFAAIVLASKPTNGAPPLITLHGRYPRIIHGEIMTHRLFSRNARSSRAVPVRRMLEEVRTEPFVPWRWGKNQAGMQAGEDHNAFILWPDSSIHFTNGSSVQGAVTREEGWLKARDFAAKTAEAYMNAGYHKQMPNRLLEPFAWIDTLITSTSWANFLHLRDHEDAEPHFQDFALLVRKALDWVSKHDAFQALEPGHWHMPYITEADWDMAYDYVMRRGLAVEENSHLKAQELLKKISAARCARISYAPFDGNASYERELERYAELVGGSRLHASPTEHQASPDDWDDYENGGGEWQASHLAGNLGPGWIQYRKTLPGEYVAG